MEKIIELKGDIIKNNTLKFVDETIKNHSGTYNIIKISSQHIKLLISAKDNDFYLIIGKFSDLIVNDNNSNKNPIIKPSLKDKTVPKDFYSTTNHPTEVFLHNRWVIVKNIRMDAVLVVKDDEIYTTKLRDVKKDDLIVCNHEGVRIKDNINNSHEHEFAFMINEVSSERRVELSVKELAKEMATIKNRSGKIIFVAGPVVVHTGGMDSFKSIINKGYVSGLLSGNALAVHDIEYDLFGTSLGVDLNSGKVISGGHCHHMRAINAVNTSGSIAEAVSDGSIKSGIMYEIIKNKIPFVLAGSIRDDGPLPDTIMDLIAAQNAYSELIKDADMVIMLSSMLHSIGTGNMLPSNVKTVCVDINPAVVNKLIDRGSAQTKGLVTDVGLFLTLLNQNLV